MKSDVRFMDILVIDESLDKWRKARKSFSSWNCTVNAKAYMKFRTKPELVNKGYAPANVFIRTEPVPGHTKRYDSIFVWHGAPAEMRVALKQLLKDESKDLLDLDIYKKEKTEEGVATA